MERKAKTKTKAKAKAEAIPSSLSLCVWFYQRYSLSVSAYFSLDEIAPVGKRKFQMFLAYEV